MTEIYFPDGSKETQIKSLETKKLEIITRNEEEIEFEYDNRLNMMSYSHATGNSSQKCLYEYLKKDFLKLARSTNSPSANIEFEYDKLDRLTRVKSKSNTNTDYVYDEESNLIEIKVNNEFDIKYVYNSENKLTKVVDLLTNKDLTMVEYFDGEIRISNLNEENLHEFKYEPRTNEILEYSLKNKIKSFPM
jgi:YD repeat-containing protein